MANQLVTRLLKRCRNAEPLWRAYRGTEWRTTAVVVRDQCWSPSLLTKSPSDQANQPNGPRATYRDKPIAQECSRVIALRSRHESE